MADPAGLEAFRPSPQKSSRLLVQMKANGRPHSDVPRKVAEDLAFPEWPECGGRRRIAGWEGHPSEVARKLEPKTP